MTRGGCRRWGAGFRSPPHPASAAPRGSRYARALAAGLLAAGLTGGSGAGGRAEAQVAAPVTFAGQVTDTYWGAPVEGAIVRITGTLRPDGSAIAGFTDDEGRFSIERVPAGPSRVLVSRIGYADLVQVLDIQDGQFVDVVVIPKPVVLEGIEIYVDRLQGRLRALPFTANVFEETALKLSPTLNVAAYLDSQPGFEFVPCFTGGSPTGVYTQRRDCIRTRGTTPQRPRIFIDDAPAMGGVRELATLPTIEMYRVEVIRGCGQIRVYTTNYVEGTASRGFPLLPIIC